MLELEAALQIGVKSVLLMGNCPFIYSVFTHPPIQPIPIPRSALSLSILLSFTKRLLLLSYFKRIQEASANVATVASGFARVHGVHSTDRGGAGGLAQKEWINRY